ncbi:MAG: O-acetyl-ADP-ribose deacetylase [Firmicutes bacterium ADurb.Bin456]|nr:MAG: O-acetyl-ADP-ribose deacetylase [Firmicutes bacterium ADurb.Bin456]
MIKVTKGDLTELAADAVVNAANTQLLMGAGVAGAIKRKGGSAIEAEAVARGPVSPGEAVVTGAGALKVKYVIHAAVMGPDRITDAATVRLATRSALQRAGELGLKSVIFPALGTGAGGLDLDLAAAVMVSEVRGYMARVGGLEEVIFALFDEKGYNAFSRLASRRRIVCLGDSITFGYPYGPEASWVSICAGVSGLELVNKGINGDTTWDMLTRFWYDVVELEPAYVIILGGTNDIFSGISLKGIQNNVLYMVNEALDQGICPILGLPPPVNISRAGSFFPRSVMGSLAKQLSALVNWVEEFAASQALPVLDFQVPLMDLDSGKAIPCYYGDDAHPNRSGYMSLALAAEDLVLRLKKGLE